MSKIIRYCKLKEEHFGDNAFDVSRPNIMGNPYTHIKNKETLALVKVKTRDEAVELYSPYFDKMYAENEEFKAEVDRMYEAYKKYPEIYIGCYCDVEKEKCHTEVIAKKLMQRSMKEKIERVRQERGGVISQK